jgi:hypothetical protein
MSLTVKIKGDASHFDKTIGSVNKGMSRLGIGIAAVGAAATAAAGVAAWKFLDFLKSSSKAAAGVESLKMQFEVLLGSADAAGKRMEEIIKFAASTPFEVDELARTSKLLQTLGGTLLATGDGLRMVGDATAIAGQPIEEMGLHIGRLFNALTSGTSAGEAVARLQEVGLITGDAKTKFEELAAAQKKGTQPILTQKQALGLLQNVMSKTSGAMAKLSETTEGKLSNMADAVSQFKVAFGTGLNEGVTAGAEAFSKGLSGMQDQASVMGGVFGRAIKDSFEGEYEGMVEIGVRISQAIGAGMKAGMKIAWVSLGESVLEGIDALGDFVDPLGGAAGKEQAANLVSKRKNEYIARVIEDAVIGMRDAMNSLSAPVGVTPTAQRLFDQGVRAGDPGYGGTEMSKMLETLERIARAVDKPFPN